MDIQKLNRHKRVLRSSQGLLFFFVSVFALKWEFREVLGHADFLGQGVLHVLPPLKEWMLFLESAVLALIGIYLVITGEWVPLRNRCGVSLYTFPAAFAIWIAVFVRKFTYHSSQTLSSYYPPLSEESLSVVYVALLLLAFYFLFKGEVETFSRNT